LILLESLIDRIYKFFEYRHYKYDLNGNFIYKYRGAKDCKTKFEGFNTLFSYAECCECEIGRYSYIQSYSKLLRTKVGRFCSIADNVRSGFGQHPISMVSTFPSFYQNTSNILKHTIYEGSCKFDLYKKSNVDNRFIVTIGNDVWVGSHVLIMDGISIGDGAIIGAGAVVTKNIEPYAIYAGVPAKFIRYRFSKEIREKLLSIQWWNKDDDWIRSNCELFENVEEFIYKVDKLKNNT